MRAALLPSARSHASTRAGFAGCTTHKEHH